MIQERKKGIIHLDRKYILSFLRKRNETKFIGTVSGNIAVKFFKSINMFI